MKYTAWIVQLEEKVQVLKEVLAFSKRRNNVVDLRYYKLSNDCDLRKHHITRGIVISGEIDRTANLQ